jgi:hypothetical protein
MGREAGFSAAAAHDKIVSRSGRNDGVWWVGGERHSGRYAPLENAGILRCAQNDDVKLATAKETATATAKTKYRDLSTAAAKCAAFGRDDVCYGWLKENKQPQEQRQRQEQQ